MIFSERKMFADKQVIALASNTVLNSVELEHEIFLGYTKIPYGCFRELHQNIGAGDGIPIMAFIDSHNTGTGTEYFITLEAADGGAWTTIFTSPTSKGQGDYLHFKYLPDNSKAYLRVRLHYKQASALTGRKATVTAAIGTYKPTPFSNASI